MRTAIVATAATAAGLVAANMLGVAAAEAPTGSTAVRSVSVAGVAVVPVTQGASAAVATAAYRVAMSAAVSDGQSKAEFLATKTGAALGAVASIAEGGGSISCTDASGSEYAEYTGEQPDFGYAQPPAGTIRAAAGVAAPSGAPAVKRLHRSKRRRTSPTAKKATAPGCTLSTQVSLTYAIG
jgi:hypothetical protein